MKKDRHYYYSELDNDNNLIHDRDWIKEAMRCTLEKHSQWNDVKDDSLDKIIDDKSFKIKDYLEFISMKNKNIAAELRKLEGRVDPI